jgi:Uma2 family endonuclease
MSRIRVSEECGALVLRSVPILRRMSSDEFFELCQQNRDLRIERTRDGDLVIMPPTGSETGTISADFTTDLNIWARKNGSGRVFDSSSGFTLPNGAVRSPDAAWIEGARWSALPAASREKFAPICPDFVAEIRSPTDSLVEVQEKMHEYIANGARLGWLIDPVARKLYIYAAAQPVQVIEDPQVVDAGPLLPGFSVDFPSLWRRA